jgi:hypothetical protein
MHSYAIRNYIESYEKETGSQGSTIVLTSNTLYLEYLFTIEREVYVVLVLVEANCIYLCVIL